MQFKEAIGSDVVKVTVNCKRQYGTEVELCKLYKIDVSRIIIEL